MNWYVSMLHNVMFANSRCEVSFNATVKAGETFQDKVPGWGFGTLVSITTAKIVNVTQFDETEESPFFNLTTTYITYTLAADSVTDVTHRKKSDGTMSLSFPADSQGSEYIIYASYYHLSLARNCIPGPNPTNFIQNGSFAVDHFSPNGARVTTDFLEKYVLVDGVRELFKQVGNYSKSRFSVFEITH